MPVYGDDEVARLAESYNEMAASIQQQIHQLEEFGALQRRFTSDVSHELRTPLTTVRMAAEVLHAQAEDTKDTDPIVFRSAQLLVDELDRFESLLGDLLEISRLDAGVAELANERVDIRDIVRRSAETVRHLVDETATPLLLDLTEDAEAEVDPRRVERILRNLLANAIDHGESRPVEVRVAADEHAVAVVVRDHGVGLKPGEAGLVFNRFWRADPSRQRRSGGTGLGLAISLEDARLQGGWLQAWGETDHGAVFRLTLPRVAGALLRTSPLPLIPVTAAPAEAEPGIQEAAVTTGTALPPPTGEIPAVRSGDDEEGGDGPGPADTDRPGAVSGRGDPW
jgi:two-component system sensor histidine kinase MtrB